MKVSDKRGNCVTKKAIFIVGSLSGTVSCGYIAIEEK